MCFLFITYIQNSRITSYYFGQLLECNIHIFLKDFLYFIKPLRKSSRNLFIDLCSKSFVIEKFIAWSGNKIKVLNKILVWLRSEAATETIFENICSFLPGASFSELFYVFTEQILIFQEDIFFRRTDRNFPGDVFSARRTDNNFSRKVFLFFEQIPIFQEQFVLATEQIPIFQEHFFGYRTDTDFPGSLF